MILILLAVSQAMILKPLAFHAVKTIKLDPCLPGSVNNTALNNEKYAKTAKDIGC